MQVELFKRIVTYKDGEGEERKATNFFLKCGDVIVPVEVKYFENKETGKDKDFVTRKTVLSAFADELPERNNGEKAKSEKDVE